MINKQQKELLLKICELHSQKFFLNMIDTWGMFDGECDAQYARDIRKSEEEYKNKYGELPVWNTIEDMWKTKEEISH